MNYVNYVKCIDKNCINQQKQIGLDKKLIEIQQKIIKAKSVQTQETNIRVFNNLKVKREFLTCMIGKCKHELLNQYRDTLEFNKGKLVKIKNLPKVIRYSIKICEDLLSKHTLNDKDVKILAIHLDNLVFYTSYLVK